MITTLHTFINYRIYAHADLYRDAGILATIKALGFFNAANSQSTAIVPFQSFYNELLNNTLGPFDPKRANIYTDYIRWTRREHGFSYCQYPFLLSIANKSNLLKLEANEQMKLAIRESVHKRHNRAKYLELRIRRDLLIDTTIHELINKPFDLKKELKVQFIGEDGVDAGGVKQEFFQLIVREIFDPKYGMFTYNEETNLFWFNSHSLESEQEYHLIGMIVGLAIYNNVILDLHFPLVTYKKLLRKRVYFSDLTEVDPLMHKGLIQMKEFDGDVEDVFCRHFVVEEEVFGEVRKHPLKPGGEDIALNNHNRDEYADLYAKFLLHDSVARQFNSFYNGFHQICGGNALALLKPEELELLVCGNPEIDFKKLEMVSQYYGFRKESKTVRYFWEIVHELPYEEKKKLLFFITGSDRVPFEGVGQISLNISRGRTASRSFLPTAHTCFNQLVLPDYQDKALLKEKLLIAINNAEGFGLK